MMCESSGSMFKKVTSTPGKMPDKQTMQLSDPITTESPKEECGIFGVFGRGEDVARLAFFGLFALQHRGQESAGIAVSDGLDIRVHKEMGLVNQVFNEEILQSLQG